MNKNNICYTGVGSLKTGNHTEKQYLKVMNKNYKKKCSIYIKSLKCKSCKKMMNTTEKINKCKRCKNNKTKKCNLKKNILFSGAEFGKCDPLK